MYKTNLRNTIVTIAALLISGSAIAQDLFSITVDESYEDTLFAVESAILDRGLNIDNVSHVGDMLARTGGDVGASETLFDGASVFNFCSAKLSREVMTLDRTNIRYCPYGVFVYSDPQNPDQTVIGHQIYPSPDMAVVNTLLDEIVTDASEY